MDITLNPVTSHISDQLTTANATHLTQLIQQGLFDNIKVLSLDCFDTLLWRKSATPIDVFYDLQNQPTFKSLNFSAFLRKQGESTARLKKLLQEGKNEVNLREIYLTQYPLLNEKQLESLEAEELATEMESCYPYLPIINLLNEASHRGIKIIIVSDTYFNHSQLESLLKATLPTTAFNAIHSLFPSNEYGRSKINGLFKFVLEKMQTPAQQILHIGDNPVSDFFPAKSLHMKAIHFIQQTDENQDLFRMQDVALNLMDSSVRQQRSLPSPYKAILSLSSTTDKSPESQIGYCSIGPIMYSFMRFIQNKMLELKNMGKTLKPIFLMRDGYLPYLSYKEINDKQECQLVRISRFTTLAASFKTQDDIDLYLCDVLFSNRFQEILKQLLVPTEIAEPLVKKVLAAQDPHHEFINAIHDKGIMNMIIKKSTEFRKRLINHIVKTSGIKENETLVFIDLGYSGTTQRLLEPLLREELKIDVYGIYLIALGIPEWQKTRCGLLDTSWCDERVLLSLVASISLLEQISTTDEASTINYEEDGTPIFATSNVATKQHQQREKIQKECLRFIKNADQFYNQIHTPFAIELFRTNALAEITRLLFLPSEAEIQYFQSFEFDLNVGAEDKFKLFDIEKGLDSLRKRSIFFTSMEKSLKNIRMNYPAELRAAGLELGIYYLMQQRYGLSFNFNDTSLRHEIVNAIIMKDQNHSQTQLKAIHTHDGYFSLVIPIGNGNIQTGIIFGHHYQWLQFNSIEMINMDAYLKNNELEHTIDCWQFTHFIKMDNRGDKLYECQNKEAVTIIAPTIQATDANYVVRLVFRPICKWD